MPDREQLLMQTDDAVVREALATTASYKDEALKLALAEANRVAGALALPESVPITKSALTEIAIATPFVSHHLWANRHP